MHTITMQISDNETQRIFFLIRERTSRCWEGFGKKCCECLRLRVASVAVSVSTWELDTSPSGKVSSPSLRRNKNNAISSPFKVVTANVGSVREQTACKHARSAASLKLINLLRGRCIKKSELRTGYLSQRVERRAKSDRLL